MSFFLLKRNTTLRLLSPQSGFTFIELMIVVAIMSVVVLSGVATYRRFDTRQSATTQAKEFLVGLRQAQGKASSGVKTVTGCATTPLVGHRITSLADRSGYTVSEVYASACNGNTAHVSKTVTLPATLQFQNTFSITFTGQSGLVSFGSGGNSLSVSICTASCALRYQIDISSGGSIDDRGFL